MARYSVPNGRNIVEFEIPDNVDVTIVESKPLPIIANQKDAIEKEIKNPIGSRRLSQLVRPGQKVAIVVTDVTRKLPEDIMLPIIIDELIEGGVDIGDITGVVATGTHRPNTREELIEMFGADTVSRIRFVNHDAWNAERLVDLGKSRRGIPLVVNKEVAEADVRISTGVIETHLFAGYSGGVKSVAVGVAGEATIGATHNYAMLSHTRLGVIEGNAFREFLTEATTTIGLDFIVNVVQTGKKELVKVVAGDPVQAFVEGVKTARAMYEVEIQEDADIIVAGVGYPKNRDLYQATRAANTSVFGPKPVVRKGGLIIIPASCEDGFGHPGYVDWMTGCSGPEEIIEYARTKGFAPGEQKALILAWIMKQARMVISDCQISAEDLGRIHLDSASSVQEAIDRELQRKPDAKVMIIPDSLLTLPVIRQ